MFVIDKKIYHFENKIKKSQFFIVAKKIQSKEELKNFLNQYQDSTATHNCYAYKIGFQQQTAGFEDDGEPQGTAGSSILKVIEKKNLTNIVVLIIRHFGGIKLGAGGLIRAYGGLTNQILSRVNFLELKNGFKYQISFSFNQIKDVDNFCRKEKITILSKKYDNYVHYQFTSFEQNFCQKIPFKILNCQQEKILIETPY